MSAHGIVESETREVAYQLLGLSYLLQNFRSEGSGARDGEAMIGIGILFESLYRRQMRISEVVSRLHKIDPNLELDRHRHEYDGLATVEEALEQSV